MWKKNRLYNFVALLMGFMFTALPFATQAAEREDLAKAVQHRYASIDAFTATFIQTLRHQGSEAEEIRMGSLSFKKPRLLHFETNAPFAQTIVASSNELWDYVPDDEVVYQYPLSIMDNSVSILNVITGQSRFDKDFIVQENPRDGAWRVLVLFPYEPTTQFVEATLWIHAKNYLIERVIITDFYANTNDLRFQDMKLNPNLPESRFVFTPPDGVDVEDLREGTTLDRPFFQ